MYGKNMTHVKNITNNHWQPQTLSCGYMAVAGTVARSLASSRNISYLTLT